MSRPFTLRQMREAIMKNQNVTPGATLTAEDSDGLGAESSGPRGLREGEDIELIRRVERSANEVISARTLKDEEWEERAWHALDTAWQALGRARGKRV